MALQERHKSFSSSKVHTTTMGVQRLMTQALDVEDEWDECRGGSCPFRSGVDVLKTGEQQTQCGGSVSGV